MKALAVVAVVAALGMSAAALALTLDQRNADEPVLALWRFELGAMATEAYRVPPGEERIMDSTCPRGYVVVSGGEETIGPAIVTHSGSTSSTGRRVWSRKVYNAADDLPNAADALGTGSDEVRVGTSLLCMKLRGIKLRLAGPFW